MLFQLIENGGNLGCVDLGRLLGSAAIGAASGLPSCTNLASAAKVVGVNHENFPEPLKAIEIGALDYMEAQRAGGSYLGAAAYVSRFLEFFLNEGSFSRLAWIDESGGFWRTIVGGPKNTCRIVASFDEAIRDKSKLQRASLKGWQVLFVVSKQGSVVADFLTTAEYRITGHSQLGSGQSGDPLGFFSELGRGCLSSLSLTNRESIVVFAHDADPVYVIGHA